MNQTTFSLPFNVCHHIFTHILNYIGWSTASIQELHTQMCPDEPAPPAKQHSLFLSGEFESIKRVTLITCLRTIYSFGHFVISVCFHAAVMALEWSPEHKMKWGAPQGKKKTAFEPRQRAQWLADSIGLARIHHFKLLNIRYVSKRISENIS